MSQVPLTEQVKAISAFVMADLFQYTVMTFGMHNALANFQRLMNTILVSRLFCEPFELSFADI